MGATAACIRRVDCRYSRRRVLVRSTSLFPGRYLMKRGIVLGLLLAFGALSMALAANFQNPPAEQVRVAVAQAPAAPPLGIQQVKDNLYMITGGCQCGNTGVFVTSAGVVVV